MVADEYFAPMLVDGEDFGVGDDGDIGGGFQGAQEDVDGVGEEADAQAPVGTWNCEISAGDGFRAGDAVPARASRRWSPF